MANTVYKVSTAAQLTSALALCKGGETILLAGGDYGSLKLSDHGGVDVAFESPITIKSADPTNPASFDRLNVDGASNVVIDSVVFDYTFKSTDDIKVKPFEVTDSSNIVIKNSVFDGDVASGVSTVSDGYGFGQGLVVRNSSSVTIENNEFFDWHRGAVFDNSKGLVITGNEMHSIRSDGMNFVLVNNVLIEDNYIHDFKASPTSTDHRDMIQFWTTGTTKPSTNIVIRGNTLDIGEGSYTQSIFMRNEMVDSGGAGASMFYQNVLIEDNAIYNAHLHGITVGETNGLTIRNNSVLRVDSDGAPEAANGEGTWVPVINVKASSTNVAIEYNAVDTININGTASTAAWSVKNNAYVQDNDPDAPGYYGDQFITSSMTPEDGVHNYAVKPGSTIDTLNAGSSQLEYDTTPDQVTAYFGTTAEHDGDRGITFDATSSLGADGVAILSKAQFIWDFGDGTTASGLVVKHDFSKAGYYDVTLKIVLPNGTSSIAHQQVGVAGADLLSFDAKTGKFLNHSYGETDPASGSIKQLVAVSGGSAIDLGGTGVQASVGGIGQIYDTDDFDISLKLQADGKGTAYGEVFRIHGALTASVTSDGNFYLNLKTDDGTTHKLTTTGGTLNDGLAHSVSIDFNSAKGQLNILIDGKVAATKSISGELYKGSTNAVDFGNAWGKKNFEGKLLDFDLNLNNDDYPTAAPAKTTVLTASATASATVTPVAVPAPVVVSDPVEAPPAPDPVVTDPVADQPSSPQKAPVLDGYTLNIAAVTSKMLMENAAVVTEDGTPRLRMDGDKDYVNVGRLTQYEQSDQIAFSVDFSRDEADGSTDRLVWNHMKVGLTLQEDGLAVHVATAGGELKGFTVKDLGLNDTDLHNATVLLDQDGDRLQIFVDDKLVLDETGTDFQFTGAGGREAGWTLGTAWNRYFDGDVTDFQVSDSFDFLNEPVHVPDANLVS